MRWSFDGFEGEFVIDGPADGALGLSEGRRGREQDQDRRSGAEAAHTGIVSSESETCWRIGNVLANPESARHPKIFHAR